MCYWEQEDKVSTCDVGCKEAMSHNWQVMKSHEIVKDKSERPALLPSVTYLVDNIVSNKKKLHSPSISVKEY